MKYISILVVLFFISCNQGDEMKTANDVLLVEVYDNSLYLSDLRGIFDSEITREDSIKILRTAVDNWIKETLLMRDAKNRMTPDNEIDKLTEDYRNSLILRHYEKTLIEQEQDSEVSIEEITSYYNKNRKSFILDQDLFLFKLIIIPLEVETAKYFKDWWKKGGGKLDDEVESFIGSNTNKFILGDSVWMKKNDLIDLLPKKSLSMVDVFDGKPHDLTGKENRFYIKIDSIVSKGEVAPLDNVKLIIDKLIIHNNRINTLKDKKEQLLISEKSKNNVKIYID